MRGRQCQLFFSGSFPLQCIRHSLKDLDFEPALTDKATTCLEHFVQCLVMPACIDSCIPHFGKLQQEMYNKVKLGRKQCQRLQQAHGPLEAVNELLLGSMPTSV